MTDVVVSNDIEVKEEAAMAADLDDPLEKVEPEDEMAAAGTEQTNGHESDANNVSNVDSASAMGDDDSDLESIRARVKEMEAEAQQIRKMQSEVERQMNTSGGSSALSTSGLDVSMEEKAEIDARSVYVGNVDYGATAEELEAHFHGCGSINRVTILCDKFSGHPKGFAYVEFADTESVQTSVALDESLFRGRQIKVSAKRTNKPGFSSTNRPPRARGRGRGRFPGFRSRGRAMYTRRRGAFFSPY